MQPGEFVLRASVQRRAVEDLLTGSGYLADGSDFAGFLTTTTGDAPARIKIDAPAYPYRSQDLASIQYYSGSTDASSTGSGTSNGAFSYTSKWVAATQTAGEYVQRRWPHAQYVNRIRILFGDHYTRIPIFFLHRADDGVAGDTTQATLRTFIQYAKSKGFQFIKLSEAHTYLRGGTLPAGITKPIVLAADDGYSHLYDGIYPVLLTESVPISLYMLTYYAGQTTRATDGAGHVYVTRGEINTMIASGNLELHSHTHNHHGAAATGVTYYVGPGVVGHPAVGPEYNPTTGAYQSQEDWYQGYVSDLLQSVAVIRTYPGQTHVLGFTAPNHITTPHTRAALREAGLISSSNISYAGSNFIPNTKGCNLYRLSRVAIDQLNNSATAQAFIDAVDYTATHATRSLSVSVLYSGLSNPSVGADYLTGVPTTAITDGVLYDTLPRFGVLGGTLDQLIEPAYKGTEESGIKALKVVCDVAPSGTPVEVSQVSLYNEASNPLEVARAEMAAQMLTDVDTFGGLTWTNRNSGSVVSFELKDSTGTRQFAVGAAVNCGALIPIQMVGQSNDVSQGTSASIQWNTTKKRFRLVPSTGNGSAASVQTNISGVTGSRPTTADVGDQYFDTTLGKPIWVASVGPIVWKDAAGTTV